MNTENSVLESSPQKRGRVGLPPTNRSAAAANRARQSRFEAPAASEQPQDEYRDPPQNVNYNYDEGMSDPFGGGNGGGAGGVMNTPPKSNPLGNGGSGGGGASNFHDELAT